MANRLLLINILRSLKTMLRLRGIIPLFVQTQISAARSCRVFNINQLRKRRNRPNAVWLVNEHFKAKG